MRDEWTHAGTNGNMKCQLNTCIWMTKKIQEQQEGAWKVPFHKETNNKKK